MPAQQPTDVSDIDAGKDVQEPQAKTEDNVEADASQISPLTEFPGADTSKVESQKEEQQTEMKTRWDWKRQKKKRKISFSLHISAPHRSHLKWTIVLKAGEVIWSPLPSQDLAKSPRCCESRHKSFSLVVVTILVTCGIHKDHPYLLHCLDTASAPSTPT